MTDGGLGSQTLILGEASTSYAPVFLRDGLPDGTGHRMTDDPWLTTEQSLHVDSSPSGFMSQGQGVVALTPVDRAPDHAISQYRGIRGPHESYMRAINLLTPNTAWRLAFDFDETIDRLGYNWTNLPDDVFKEEETPRGNTSIRRSRTRLTRQLTAESSLSVEYRTVRKTREELLVLDAEIQEIWGDGARIDARHRVGDWQTRTSFFWTNRTVEWGDLSVTSHSEGRRKIETGREGLLLEMRHSPMDSAAAGSTVGSAAGSAELSASQTGLGLKWFVSRWDILDNAYGLSDASPAVLSGDRNTSEVEVSWGRPAPGGIFQMGLTGNYLEGAGLHPGAFLEYGARGPDSSWRLHLAHSGRAPRSDELLTPMTHLVYGRQLQMLPNADLEHENLLRASILLNKRLLGCDFAVEASARRLRDGITWVATESGGFIGTWQNALDMNSNKVTASIARQGRLLGWARARLEGTWQKFDEKENPAAFLPPEQYLRMELMWEQHFFAEDGILQLALLTTHRGGMDEPWDPTGQITLPSATTHDFLIGFRLVGAHLSLNYRNVTDQRTRLSSGALSPGREMDMRLNWTFLY